MAGRSRRVARRAPCPGLAHRGRAIPFALGLVAFVLVLARFDFAQLRTGPGDQWVSGGALAISTLACAELARAQAASHIVSGIHAPLRIASVALWGLTMFWLPALIAGEARWPRPSYDPRRWATVFPLGMYSVMSWRSPGPVTSRTLGEPGRGSRWPHGERRRSGW
ncbi:MAG: hypothetical protein JOZ98_13700 [Solirubrobacterales bacterium]|nr:hypothetical protein [Solirubrobacterales bacterium]